MVRANHGGGCKRGNGGQLPSEGTAQDQATGGCRSRGRNGPRQTSTTNWEEDQCGSDSYGWSAHWDAYSGRASEWWGSDSKSSQGLKQEYPSPSVSWRDDGYAKSSRSWKNNDYWSEAPADGDSQWWDYGAEERPRAGRRRAEYPGRNPGESSMGAEASCASSARAPQSKSVDRGALNTAANNGFTKCSNTGPPDSQRGRETSRVWKSGSNSGDKKRTATVPDGDDLPIDAHRERILENIRRHRVTHIQGETGCGKSTRLPQFLLEETMTTGQTQPRIIVTQPRRMAAVTLARRVASVIGEELGAGTVGYRISGDVVDGRLCFVTVGYLLQRLVNTPEEFGRYTHVILDEVHERGVDADLLTMLVKLLMHSYTNVRLIVMSATLQASLFANYFSSLSHDGKPPEVLVVGARCHPVELIFLDEIMDKFEIGDAAQRRSLDRALDVFAGFSGKGGKSRQEDKGKSKGKGKSRGLDGDTKSGGFRRVEPQIAEGLTEVTVALLQQLAKPACTVIVFLPGIADITSLFEALAPYDGTRALSDRWGQDNARSDSPKLRVFALHSMIPRTEQEEVFRIVPKDCCHIVLASNIAESSLTLPSVCAVVDLALRRTIQYDTRRLMCCLVTTWCSQSSCKQRSGRAGRTMPGRAVCLVPRRFFETHMPIFDPPEMLNAPLTKLYLQAKQLCLVLSTNRERIQLPPEANMDVSAPKALLKEVVQPPSMELLEAAMQELAAVGCLTTPHEDANITPLGRIAISLPCDLRICRLLYLGCLLRCPADAAAMAAGLTAADPFSSPSLLVLKDQKEYVQKLERSFVSRRWLDNGSFSEPLMLHRLFVEWIKAGSPHGLRGLGQFARDWSVMPKKFESLIFDAIDLTTRLVKLLKPGNSARSQLDEFLAAMHHGVDKHEELVRVHRKTSAGTVFKQETWKLRALVALAFSDQMMLHLSPRWAPNTQGKKKRQEEQIWELMRKRKMEPAETAALFVPTGVEEATMKELCAAMCGQEPYASSFEEKSKVVLVSFKDENGQGLPDHEDTLLWDVSAAVHRLHQFGSGRYRFSVELPGKDESPVELFKPLQPFLLQWEVLTHPGHTRDAKKKKPMSVRGMCDWRNPLGFACNVNHSLPPTELLGCCASVQGLEGGSQAFVAGATALPLHFLPFLLGTLCPERWNISWGFDAGSNEIRAVRILHHEIVNLPPKLLAPPVIRSINRLRAALRESLLPRDRSEVQASRRGQWGNSSASEVDLADPPDLCPVLEDLHKVLVQADPLARPKKLKWKSAVESKTGTNTDIGVLRPFQAFAETSSSRQEGGSTVGDNASGKKEWEAIIAYLSEVGECYHSSLPQEIRYPRRYLEERPDLFKVWRTKKDFRICLASPEPKEQMLINAISHILQERCQSVGLGELGSLSKVQDLLLYQKKPLQKIRSFIAAHPEAYDVHADAKGQLRVRLRQHNLGTNGSIVDDKIARLCEDSVVCASDFDERTLQFLRDTLEKKGQAYLDEIFSMLHDWLGKKSQRETVNKWSAYIMKLLKPYRMEQRAVDKAHASVEQAPYRGSHVPAWKAVPN